MAVSIFDQSIKFHVRFWSSVTYLFHIAIDKSSFQSWSMTVDSECVELAKWMDKRDRFFIDMNAKIDFFLSLDIKLLEIEYNL